MKAKLVPVYFKSAEEPDFARQLVELKALLADEAEFLDPVALGNKIPTSDGVIFPEMLGAAYRRLDRNPGTASADHGCHLRVRDGIHVGLGDQQLPECQRCQVLAPNTLEKTRQACRALALKTELKKSKFLVYQDNPASGTGLQDEIFKRFYWWEPECIAALEQRFGLKIEKKSFKELAEQAREISDAAALEVWNERKKDIPVSQITSRQVLSAVKQYMQVKGDLDADPSLRLQA